MAREATFSPDQGFVPEFDIKEDEEQNVKLQQIVELLLSAGYFRARIKGLSPFDKVVGGMTWCITTCSYDLDVDLLFQENSTIGQKIALTEKIVAVLPKMNCPHRIEPHQIQGLDFIHIFPVIQWLVKKAIETREEMGDYIRAYSISQFEKSYTMPEDMEFHKIKERAIQEITQVNASCIPRRKYKRHDSSRLEDESSRVQSTLLEYGRKVGVVTSREQSAEGRDRSTHAEVEEDEVKRREEEERITSLLSGMSLTDKQGSKITSRAVGSIIGMQSDQIQEMASKYAGKQAELEKSEQESPKLTGTHQHKRVVSQMNKQIEQQQNKLKELEKVYGELKNTATDVNSRLTSAETTYERIDVEMAKLAEMETNENQDVLNRLRHLITTNEALKKQEQEFKAHCKDEMTRLQQQIENVKSKGVNGASDDEQTKLIDAQYAADKEKLDKIRLLLARKNREISALHRKIDEVPTRAELSQYQRRFVELYNQVAMKHKETKQFYTLYNTLDDTKLYLNKEINLLNSIYDTFEQAMATPATREQFLKQFEHIVEGVKQNYNKLERKKQEEKMRRDRLNDDYLELVENQRVYYKTVKDFQEECRKNEILLSKLE